MRWVEGEERGEDVSIIAYTVKYEDRKRLGMLKEALEDKPEGKLEYLFTAMCHPAYVPDMAEVMPLLEKELEVYPHLRQRISNTIYRLEWPVVKWHFEDTEADTELLRSLIEDELINGKVIAGHLNTIARTHPFEIVNALLDMEITAKEDLCRRDVYVALCGRGGIKYLQWAEDNCDMRPYQACINAAVRGGHEDVVELIEKECGGEMEPDQEAVNGAAGNGKLRLLVNRCDGWGYFPPYMGPMKRPRMGIYKCWSGWWSVELFQAGTGLYGRRRRGV